MLLSQQLKNRLPSHPKRSLPLGYEETKDEDRTIVTTETEMLNRIIGGDLIPIARSTLLRIIETLEKGNL